MRMKPTVWYTAVSPVTVSLLHDARASLMTKRIVRKWAFRNISVYRYNTKYISCISIEGSPKNLPLKQSKLQLLLEALNLC